jgi:Fe-S-cluster containining protein
MDDLAAIVRYAAGRPQVREAVRDVYTAVQREMDARRPICVISGRCCRFEEYGHRLYVTTIELAAFAHDLEQQRRSATGAERPPHLTPDSRALTQLPAPADAGACPFQINKLCGVHPIRPFGCRMFFCDPTASEWQNQTYERFHARLKALHEELNVPYYYVEWRSALRALNLM